MFEQHDPHLGTDNSVPTTGQGQRCDHGVWLCRSDDAIRCCRCLSQLAMVPCGRGEFQLQWMTPSELAIRSLSWAV